MRLGNFEFIESLPDLKAPHALAILRPWIDVGKVGTLTLARLENLFGAKEIGRLVRPGNFLDFTRYRPTMYAKEGVREIGIPNTLVTCAKRETPRVRGKLGSTGIGEMTMVSTAPAVINAINNACGVRIYDLPATPEKVKARLDAL